MVFPPQKRVIVRFTLTATPVSTIRSRSYRLFPRGGEDSLVAYLAISTRTRSTFNSTCIVAIFSAFASYLPKLIPTNPTWSK